MVDFEAKKNGGSNLRKTGMPHEAVGRLYLGPETVELARLVEECIKREVSDDSQ